MKSIIVLQWSEFVSHEIKMYNDNELQHIGNNLVINRIRQFKKQTFLLDWYTSIND